ncbi:protoporphyrinogen oxidase HemJ [Piscirickettsia litoralis]|uniref:Protoporphyrinogen IX oxidase n=1 Tax=Piscirickettsia litoralis TaxID=1891921 RepID=A0ABX3A360_9GAMM|nr:protoporphyrinogen oxidase HemJ [Piscirickettsia litoralis]ODN43273.1 TIGR00701 family protein [Piscirickettsia litoralis]
MAWVLALHIISVICWFAGLFYLPRLFVYHAQTDDKIGLERFKVMEHKLYFYIMMPSALFTAITGVTLLHFAGIDYRHDNWMHLKLFFVALLFIYHFVCWHYLKCFKEDRNRKTHKFFRVFNEIPSIILIFVVVLVVVQPKF